MEGLKEQMMFLLDQGLHQSAASLVLLADALFEEKEFRRALVMYLDLDLLYCFHCLQNWIEDLFWKQLDLNYPGMHDAMVHHGFYSAYHNTSIRPGVVNAVRRARELYGRIGVLVTGHSMGGAMATFCALDLKVNYGANITQLITFGHHVLGIQCLLPTSVNMCQLLSVSLMNMIWCLICLHIIPTSLRRHTIIFLVRYGFILLVWEAWYTELSKYAAALVRTQFAAGLSLGTAFLTI